MVFWWFSLLWIIRNSHSLQISTGDFFSATSIVQFTLSGFGLWREGSEQQQVVFISGVYTQQFASSSRTETRIEEREGPLGRQHKHTQIRAGTLNELENKKKSKSWSFGRRCCWWISPISSSFTDFIIAQTTSKTFSYLFLPINDCCRSVLSRSSRVEWSEWVKNVRESNKTAAANKADTRRVWVRRKALWM